MEQNSSDKHDDFMSFHKSNIL